MLDGPALDPLAFLQNGLILLEVYVCRREVAPALVVAAIAVVLDEGTWLDRRKIEAINPTEAEPKRSKVPLRRFRDSAKHGHVKCPRAKILRPNKTRMSHGRFFASKVRDCNSFGLATICFSPSRVTRAAVFVQDKPARPRLLSPYLNDGFCTEELAAMA